MQLQMVCAKALESELNPKQWGHSFSLVPTLVLVPTKADPTTKKQSCKQGMVGADSAGHMY